MSHALCAGVYFNYFFIFLFSKSILVTETSSWHPLADQCFFLAGSASVIRLDARGLDSNNRIGNSYSGMSNCQLEFQNSSPWIVVPCTKALIFLLAYWDYVCGRASIIYLQEFSESCDWGKLHLKPSVDYEHPFGCWILSWGELSS